MSAFESVECNLTLLIRCFQLAPGMWREGQKKEPFRHEHRPFLFSGSANESCLVSYPTMIQLTKIVGKFGRLREHWESLLTRWAWRQDMIMRGIQAAKRALVNHLAKSKQVCLRFLAYHNKLCHWNVDYCVGNKHVEQGWQDTTCAKDYKPFTSFVWGSIHNARH